MSIDSDIRSLILLITSVIGLMYGLLKLVMFIFKNEQDIGNMLKNQNATRDTLIVLLNILLLYAAPALAIWYQWDKPPSGMRLATLIISWTLIIVNAGIWFVFWVMNSTLNEEMKKKKR